MMRGKKFFSAVLAFVLALPGWGAQQSGEHIFVIANNALELKPEEIRNVFLGQKEIIGHIKVTPIDNAALREEFLRRALNMNSLKYITIWTKKGFRDGVNPPLQQFGDAEVISTVKSTPGAVGYVSTVPEGVKVVGKY